jgi:murein DD-endopeptidase MepM/ murein hydrolase activator NlpD
MIGAACACHLATSSSSLVAASSQGSISRLDDPGTALQPAERLALRLPAPAPEPVPGRPQLPVAAGKLLFPVAAGSDCYILDNFGDARGSTRLHEGVDIMGSAGREVFAVASGVLTRRYTNTGTAGWGWTLYDESTDTTYQYFHLAEDAVGLAEGSTVTVGETIGRVGNSGTFGENNFHLHFEVRPKRVAIDPLPLLVVDRDVLSVQRRV